MTPSTPQQRRRLGAMRAKMFGSNGSSGKENPGWTGLIESYGVESIADLNYNQASELLRVLNGDLTPRANTFTGVGGWHLTQAQADEIGRLETALGWSISPWRLKALIKKLFRNDQKRLFDPQDCRPIVERLKKRQASTLIYIMLKIYDREFNHAEY